MHVVEVIPIARGIATDSLTYFSAAPVIPGSVVSVPLRKRLIKGIAVSSRPAAELRSQVRGASFALQKIRTVGKPIFGESFLRAVATTAAYHAATPGAILSLLTPASVLKKLNALPSVPAEAAGRGFEELALQVPHDERLSEYRSLIRECFARKESLLLIAPTIPEVLSLEADLSRGVDDYVVALHSELGGGEFVRRFTEALSNPHPLLIIGTPLILSLPRADISLIILEREGARSYKQLVRPFLDSTRAARECARARRVRLLRGDLPLRFETLLRLEEHEVAEIAPVRSRIPFEGPLRVIDMRIYRKNAKGFRIISDELEHSLRSTLENRGRAFLYVTRRGSSSSVVCEDCGTIVSCEKCDHAVVLHKTPGGNVFLCHSCGARRGAQERCKTCSGWKLAVIGVASAGTAEAVAKLFPRVSVIRLDADTARSHKGAAALAREFYEREGSVLVGTERALPYVASSVELTAVVSLDTFFALPDFRSNERAFSLLMRLRERAARETIVQTRDPERSVFAHARAGTVAEFYREEMADRERFSYPPFSTLIRISASGRKPSVEKLITEIKEELQAWEPTLFPGMLKGAGGVSAHLLIKVSTWPDEELRARLSSLPPQVEVEVGAGSVLPN